MLAPVGGELVVASKECGAGERFGEGLKTNCIARGCKVIMKRNTIWDAMGTDPDDKPLLVQEVSRLFAGSAERVLLDYRVPDDRAPGEWRVLSAAITLMRAA